jgi:hypothetical protein
MKAKKLIKIESFLKSSGKLQKAPKFKASYEVSKKLCKS